MPIGMPDKLEPLNGGDYELMDAKHIKMPNGKRLSTFGESYNLVEEAATVVPQRDGRFFILEPETYYAFGQVDSLAIYCQEPADGRVHEFAFEFTPTTNFTELEFYGETAPQWAIAPQLKAGKPCQVSIMRGIGVSVGVI